jgi:hypothetical protein
MRVTSSLFVAALVRRASDLGAECVVARRGAAEAGAIFVSVDRLDGTNDLYSPAPQSVFAAPGHSGEDDRLFSRTLVGRPEPEVAARLASEIRFDPDLWVVAIADRAGRAFIELARE